MARRLVAWNCIGVLLLAVNAACAGQHRDSNPPPESTCPVTARIKAIPLGDALQKLTQLIHVPLLASKDVADLKVTIMVRDLPLNVLQARLAEVLHLTWMLREGANGSPPSYLIYRSARNIDEENELRLRGERAFRRGIEEAIHVLSLPPRERDKMLAEHEALAETFAQSGGETAVTLLAQLSPEMRESIMDGNKMEFPSSQPPAELAGHFDVIMQHLQAGDAAAVAPGIFGQAGIFGQPGTFAVTRTGEGAGSQIGVSFSVRTDSMAGTVGFGVKGTHTGEVYPDLYKPNHTGKSYDGARKRVAIPAKLTANSLDDLLEAVSDAFHIDIVRESYREYFEKRAGARDLYPLSVPVGPTTALEALDGIVWTNCWWKRGNVYMIQRPLWWIDRRAEVTDATLARMKEILKKAPISLGDLGEIGKTLSSDQWGALNGLPGEGLRRHNYPVEWQPLLAFYGSLPASLKSDLFRPGGIDAASLSDADKERLRRWVYNEPRSRPYQNVPGSVRVMAIRKTPQAGERSVQFSAVFQADDSAATVLRQQVLPDGDPNPKPPSKRL